MADYRGQPLPEFNQLSGSGILKEPITVIIKDESVLAEYRAAQRCECCGKRIRGRAQPHHAVITKGAGGSDIHINLVALAADCHERIQGSQSERQRMIGIIASREGQRPEWIEEENFRIRRSHGSAQSS